MIVAMKKVRLVALQEEKEQLLDALQRAGEMMIVATTEEAITLDTQAEDQLLLKANQSLKIIKKYRQKKPFVREENLIDAETFFTMDEKKKELIDQIEKVDQEIASLGNLIAQLQEQERFYLPWKSLSMPLSDIKNSKYTQTLTGFIDTKKKQTFLEGLIELGALAEIIDVGIAKTSILIAYLEEDKERIHDYLKLQNVIEIVLPKKDKTPEEILFSLEEQQKEAQASIIQCEEKLQELSNQAEDIELVNDQIKTIRAKKSVPVLKTVETVYLEGWIPEERVEQLKQVVDSGASVYDMEICDAGEEELPPTYVRNNKFFSPFETVTDMFAKPKYGEIDPNPVMSFWYWLIFGMMLGDFGYGLVMFVGFYLFLKLKKPTGAGKKLFTVFMYSSVATMVWGILFGSYFGASWNPIIVDPIENAMDLLLIALGIGTLHILTGIFMKGYANIKQKKVLDAIFDQFSWIVIFIGIGFYLLLPSIPLGLILILLGAVTVVFTAGRKKSNIFGKVTGGVLGLYNITGYMSDILSYSRVLALALSSAVIGFVMNLLAGMLQGSVLGFVFSIAIYVIGHGFNMAMGLLSAYVHDGRLQYIEFFGKFYEGGGYDFRPLSVELDYIDGIKK